MSYNLFFASLELKLTLLAFVNALSTFFLLLSSLPPMLFFFARALLLMRFALDALQVPWFPLKWKIKSSLTILIRFRSPPKQADRESIV